MLYLVNYFPLKKKTHRIKDIVYNSILILSFANNLKHDF